MGYRKITVDGKEYEYVIGKTHTKVKGIKTVFLNEEIGVLSAKNCECCGESLDVIYDRETLSDHNFDIRVRPSDVADAIKSLTLYEELTAKDLFERFGLTHYSKHEAKRNELRKELRNLIDRGTIKLSASMKMEIFKKQYEKLEQKYKV